MNPNIDVIPNSSETQKVINLPSGKQLDELTNTIVTGDTSIRRIQVGVLNHVQEEGEGKYQEVHINFVRVVHDK